MTTDSPTPNIVTDDTAASLSVPELAVEYAQILAFETMVKDMVEARRDAFKARLKIAQAETGAKTFSARHADGDVMADFTFRESKAAYKVTDADALTDWVIENHPTEVDAVATITDQDAFLDFVRENSPAWAKVDFTVKPAFEKVLLAGKTLSRVEEGILEKDTGVLVEGITWVPAQSTDVLAPSWKPGGKELAAQAVIAGAADRLLSAFLAEQAPELEAAPEKVA